MRRIFSLLSLFVTGLFTNTAFAQMQWIADAAFPGSAYTTLYKTLEDGKPFVIAVGNIHALSSERLLASGTLQKLAAEHDAGKLGERFSSKDLHIAFINVQVMAAEASSLPKGIQFIHVNEGDELLSSAGWDAMYSIYGTRLFLITPDHLVHPLMSTTADEIYTEAAFYNTKIRPSAAPDVRLLDAVASSTGKTANIRIQNFSTAPVMNIQVSVLKDGQTIAQTVYTTPVAPLEDAVIPVSLPQAGNDNLTIIAKAEGDVYQLNNRWTGPLRSVANTTMIAGTFGK